VSCLPLQALFMHRTTTGGCGLLVGGACGAGYEAKSACQRVPQCPRETDSRARWQRLGAIPCAHALIVPSATLQTAVVRPHPRRSNRACHMSLLRRLLRSTDEFIERGGWGDQGAERPIALPPPLLPPGRPPVSPLTSRPPAASCLLPAACCLPPAACCLLPAACCSQAGALWRKLPHAVPVQDDGGFGAVGPLCGY
jgi:hypothetical protein